MGVIVPILDGVEGLENASTWRKSKRQMNAGLTPPVMAYNA
ncbi:hypothetical protein HMPREF1219_01316 [Corynebacterium pyruviciproducens ATCC BAA-1742]|uniref:Uncharacterized protein n=1 Tax=Corynebacterium pyruviciproducens ATCC BAA-1742 TaxID=1125779 RepID=S2YYL3_9CORY|nr:hypothetical protein HMPREF1219_01316 [Corynebacterium pyruviciproducens ATCC BAA-1742]